MTWRRRSNRIHVVMVGVDEVSFISPLGDRVGLVFGGTAFVPLQLSISPIDHALCFPNAIGRMLRWR